MVCPFAQLTRWNVRMKCDVPVTSPAFVTRFFAGEIGVSSCPNATTVIVRRSATEGEDCAKRLTDLCSPRPCAD